MNENKIKNILNNIAGIFCEDKNFLNEEFIDINIERGSSDVSSSSLRSIQKSRLDYLVDNAACLLLGFAVLEDYRNLARQSVYLEAVMHIQMPSGVIGYLRELMDASPYCPQGNEYVSFDTKVNPDDDPLITELINRCYKSFPANPDYDHMMSFSVGRLNKDDLECISFIISNFFYLFCAFANNDDFYAKTMIMVDMIKDKSGWMFRFVQDDRDTNIGGIR